MPRHGIRCTFGEPCGQQVAASDSACESSGVGELDDFLVLVGVGVGDGDAEVEALGAGCFRPFCTSARILAKSGLAGRTTLAVSGSERIEPPFWMRSARSTQADSSPRGMSMLTLFLTTFASFG